MVNISEAWAKLDEDRRTWHSLKAHSADVAAMFEWLLNNTILKKRWETIAGQPLTTDRISAFASFAAIHDAGKANSGFQGMKSPNAPRVGHVGPILDLLAVQEDFALEVGEALGLDEVGGWFQEEESLGAILAATFAHHGRAVQPDSSRARASYWKKGESYDPLRELNLLSYARFEWFPVTGQPELRIPLELEHLYNGILTLADWLASDTRFFPHCNGRDGEIERARDGAEKVGEAFGLNAESLRRSLKPDLSPLSIWGFDPRPIQSDILNCEVAEGSVVCIESDTGSGKTEAALLHFLRLFREGKVDGMYFALPTRAAALQLHSRIVNTIRTVFSENPPPVVLAVPGYIRVDDEEGVKLAPFKVLWPDKDSDSYRYRGWASESPKRYLMGAVVVGTIDQVMLSALNVKHAHMRYAALLRHLLVIDEVHASDTYMNRIIDEVLKNHRQAGGHSLLMSATLGVSARARLVPGAPLLPYDQARNVSYPLITIGGENCSTCAPAPTEYEKSVALDVSPDSNEAIAALIGGKVRDGASVLVIRNTVKQCVALHDLVSSMVPAGTLFSVDGVTCPHHSRFAAVDRKRLDREVEHFLGKDARPGPRVVIATQTVEQSLDIDADLLITDLCPIDVLLQRIGRLHRHPNRARPRGFEVPTTFVILPEEPLSEMVGNDGMGRGPNGLGTVYEDLFVCEATKRALERWKRWDIPKMNRLLVETATHEECLEVIAKEWGDAGRLHWQNLRGGESGARVIAANSLIDRSRHFYELPSPTLEERIVTRLGEDDRVVRFEPAAMGPWGSVTELRIPAHLAPRNWEESAASWVPIEGGFAFEMGPLSYTYTNIGLKRDVT